jgi:hypothetical protein
MSRQPRFEARETLHHIIGRGIEGTEIFRNEGDKRDFLFPLAQLCQAGFWMVYAWARCLSCEVAAGRMGYPAAEVAGFLRVSRSAVVRAAPGEETTTIRNEMILS